MTRVELVCVSRDPEMYSRCIAENPYAANCSKRVFDNSVENLPITVRYNSCLDSLLAGSDCWIVLCHEDWMPLCDLPARLSGLDKGFLYGPIGAVLEPGRLMDYMFVRGRVFQSRKDGSSPGPIQGEVVEGPVDTFDCQCLIFHSSLLEGRRLRFDENLGFDMYVEDFCAQARERFGIESRTIDLPCRHLSYGSTRGSFRESLSYMKKKYSCCARRYPTIVGHRKSFGGSSSRHILKVSSPLSKLIYRLAG